MSFQFTPEACTVRLWNVSGPVWVPLHTLVANAFPSEMAMTVFSAEALTATAFLSAAAQLVPAKTAGLHDNPGRFASIKRKQK